MKKIVALVLSLVMVLGLATTAFGAATYTVDMKRASTLDTVGTLDVTLTAAKAAYINAADEMVKGNVAYYTDAADTMYVSCTADTAGALILYYTGTKTVFDTVVEVANVDYLAVGTEFKDFGKACDQINNEANPLVKYYTYVNADGVAVMMQGTGVAAVAGDTQLMVDGKLVPVTTAIAQPNAHKWVVTKNAKNEIVSAKCSLCAVEAAWTLNLAAVPTGAEFEAAPGGGYLYWNAAPVATEPADKVESAQTFDAGIAMYVGMSVMAAAGSAVVLKKKD